MRLTWENGVYNDPRYSLTITTIKVKENGVELNDIFAGTANSVVFSDVQPGVEYQFMVVNEFEYNDEYYDFIVIRLPTWCLWKR